MKDNKEYQKNMQNVGKAIKSLKQCDFKTSPKLVKPYTKLQHIYVKWLRDRVQSINPSTVAKIQDMHDHYHSAQLIADTLGMNIKDVNHILEANFVDKWRINAML